MSAGSMVRHTLVSDSPPATIHIDYPALNLPENYHSVSKHRLLCDVFSSVPKKYRKAQWYQVRVEYGDDDTGEFIATHDVTDHVRRQWGELPDDDLAPGPANPLVTGPTAHPVEREGRGDHA